jgi:hypothetical protein
VRAGELIGAQCPEAMLELGRSETTSFAHNRTRQRGARDRDRLQQLNSRSCAKSSARRIVICSFYASLRS